jgi:hypothetical protein
MTDQTATEVTELDKSRRYLRPVAAMPISDDLNGVHLAVYEWMPRVEAWVTGPGLCGESMRQGPLPEGTTVTCPRCLEWRPQYERMLAPGYNPEDDDPEALRRRAETAEQQRDAAADALAAEWHRRNQRLEELTSSKGPEAQVAVVEHVRGELVGLRGALGMLLGARVQDGTADYLGWCYCQEWRRRQDAQ